MNPGKNITILAVERDEVMSPDVYMAMLEDLKNKYGVRAMQTCFNVDVPNFGERYGNHLHLTAHLRVDEREARSDIDV